MGDTRKFKELFCSCFKEDRRWTNWFFSSIAQDSDIVGVGTDDGASMLSGALLQPYGFLYEGSEIKGGYLSCVGTLPSERGRGLAAEVLRLSVCAADERGMAVISLIPAQRHLYNFYARAGFSGVYYVNEERYLSGHNFEVEGREIPVDFELFSTLEKAYGRGVLHSEEQFKYILTDLSFDSGSCVIGAEDTDGKKAILFAGYDTENSAAAIEVKALLSESRTAADLVLKLLAERVPERGITVRTEPSDSTSPKLRAAGMARITDVEAVLGALASAHPELRQTIRVTDNFIDSNNGTFTLRDGMCRRTEADRRPDLDVDIRTLTAILFSGSGIGAIFSLPTGRPLMTMMLD